jgi:hypothetical protein
MNTTALQHISRSIAAVATAALLAACAAETPLAPDTGSDVQAQLVPSAPSLARLDLGDCGKLGAPAGSTFGFHAYATGVQIYRWSGTSWVFVAPSAVLYADAGEHGVVGTHYAGPRWESVSGSYVKGEVADRCTPDASAIPWLSLKAVDAGGPGVFNRITFIQRVNTVGGTAPTESGSFTGQMKEVPYTAEYYFYR